MNIKHEALTRLVATIFQEAGCEAAEAVRIAESLVEANLVGHDSHGVIRVSHYVSFLERGIVRANQSLRVHFETDVISVLDGGLGFGQVIGHAAMRHGIEKVAKHGVAVIALRNCAHLGRIGEWAEMGARAGLVSLHWVNTSGMGMLVAPFGGIDRRISANPISAGIPVERGEPIVLDISTSAIAEGKLKVAHNKGAHVPPNCIIDSDGKPTDDPARFYADPPGSLLPFGGHKGYGLALLADILAGALTGSGCTSPEPERSSVLINGMLAILLDPSKFPPDTNFWGDVSTFVDWVKTSRTETPGGEILMPGELESRTRERRSREGVDLDERSWEQLLETAGSVGLDRDRVNELVGSADADGGGGGGAQAGSR